MTQLASGVEPLVLDDGTLIDPMTGSVISLNEDNPVLIEVPSSSQLITQQAAVKRRLADLPVPPKQMNVISVIACYSMLGVDDQAIGEATGVDPEIVSRVRLSDGYIKVFEELVKQIVETDKEYVRNMFVSSSKLAANKMVAMVNSSNEATALSAAKDILDRGGHRPADVVEHRLRVDGGLKIEIVRKDASSSFPTIDVKPDGVF